MLSFFECHLKYKFSFHTITITITTILFSTTPPAHGIYFSVFQKFHFLSSVVVVILEVFFSRKKRNQERNDGNGEKIERCWWKNYLSYLSLKKTRIIIVIADVCWQTHFLCVVENSNKNEK